MLLVPAKIKPSLLVLYWPLFLIKINVINWTIYDIGLVLSWAQGVQTVVPVWWRNCGEMWNNPTAFQSILFSCTHLVFPHLSNTAGSLHVFSTMLTHMHASHREPQVMWFKYCYESHKESSGEKINALTACETPLSAFYKKQGGHNIRIAYACVCEPFRVWMWLI